MSNQTITLTGVINSVSEDSAQAVVFVESLGDADITVIFPATQVSGFQPGERIAITGYKRDDTLFGETIEWCDLPTFVTSYPLTLPQLSMAYQLLTAIKQDDQAAITSIRDSIRDSLSVEERRTIYNYLDELREEALDR